MAAMTYHALIVPLCGKWAVRLKARALFGLRAVVREASPSALA
jgi:hypothetical protein